MNVERVVGMEQEVTEPIKAREGPSIALGGAMEDAPSVQSSSGGASSGSQASKEDSRVLDRLAEHRVRKNAEKGGEESTAPSSAPGAGVPRESSPGPSASMVSGGQESYTTTMLGKLQFLEKARMVAELEAATSLAEKKKMILARKQELKKLQMEERVLKAQDEAEMEEADLMVLEAQQKAHLMTLEKDIAEVKSSKGSHVSRRTSMGVEKPEQRGIDLSLIHI